MVKIKVTSLIEVMFIYLKIKAPHLKKKKIEPYYRFWKIREYEFFSVKSG